MNNRIPTPSQPNFGWSASAFRPTLAKKIDRTVRRSAPHHRWYRVDDESKLIFATLQLGVKFLQTVSRVVAYVRQICQLIFPSRDNLIGEITARQRSRSLHEVLKRQCNAPGDCQSKPDRAE